MVLVYVEGGRQLLAIYGSSLEGQVVGQSSFM